MTNWHTVPPWAPIDVPSGKLPYCLGKQSQVLMDLSVERSPRYKRSESSTYCNIFVWDYTRAMGCEVPHWVNTDGEPEEVGKGKELNANGVCRWLDQHGPRYGWFNCDRSTAFDAASRGHVAVVGWDSKTTKPGHVAILLQEGTVAQAGAQNFVGRTVREAFGTLPVQFWVWALGKHLTPSDCGGKV